MSTSSNVSPCGACQCYPCACDAVEINEGRYSFINQTPICNECYCIPCLCLDKPEDSCPGSCADCKCESPKCDHCGQVECICTHDYLLLGGLDGCSRCVHLKAVIRNLLDALD